MLRTTKVLSAPTNWTPHLSGDMSTSLRRPCALLRPLVAGQSRRLHSSGTTKRVYCCIETQQSVSQSLLCASMHTSCRTRCRCSYYCCLWSTPCRSVTEVQVKFTIIFEQPFLSHVAGGPRSIVVGGWVGSCVGLCAVWICVGGWVGAFCEAGLTVALSSILADGAD